MNIYKHVVEQPFIFATGIAALVHSTWSIGTLFSGKQPPAGVTVEFIGWIVPAFLIAFALDVGQIATSAEIRAGNRSWAKYATFGIFAVSTFYLQWLYIAHHMPALELSFGVRAEWSWFATLLRDASIWIIPAFLPLSTLMYTFSSDHATASPVQESPIAVVQIETSQVKGLPALEETIEAIPAPTPAEEPMLQPLKHLDEVFNEHTAKCDACGWEKLYDNPRSARAALSTHMARYCKAIHLELSPVHTETNGNGNH